MAKAHTPTITEITKKLKRAGFRKAYHEELPTRWKFTYGDHGKAQRSFPQALPKEPKPTYGKKKKNIIDVSAILL